MNANGKPEPFRTLEAAQDRAFDLACAAVDEKGTPESRQRAAEAYSRAQDDVIAAMDALEEYSS